MTLKSDAEMIGTKNENENDESAKETEIAKKETGLAGKDNMNDKNESRDSQENKNNISVINEKSSDLSQTSVFSKFGNSLIIGRKGSPNLDWLTLNQFCQKLNENTGKNFITMSNMTGTKMYEYMVSLGWTVNQYTADVLKMAFPEK